jgi:hypothetical protein
MQMILDGPYREAVRRLQQMHGEKTAIAIVRQAVRDMAQRDGAWPNGQPTDQPEPEYNTTEAAA